MVCAVPDLCYGSAGVMIYLGWQYDTQYELMHIFMFITGLLSVY